jgi:hypothetical protein
MFGQSQRSPSWQADLILTLPPNRRFQMAKRFQYNSQAMVPMLFAISKHVRGRIIWLEDVVPAPRWSGYQDALCFHSDMDAQITLKFLPGTARRGAAVVRWSESSRSPLGNRLAGHPIDYRIRTIPDDPPIQGPDSISRVPIAMPVAELARRFVDECLSQDAGKPLQ